MKMETNKQNIRERHYRRTKQGSPNHEDTQCSEEHLNSHSSPFFAMVLNLYVFQPQTQHLLPYQPHEVLSNFVDFVDGRL